MAWAKPWFTRHEVNWAGRSLVQIFSNDDLSDFAWRDFERAMEIIDNWRACHGYPLNTFQINLRRAARRLDTTALIAQRTKRLSSIFSKLRRFPNMKLSQMQDIGGCRAVVRSVAATRQLDQYYTKESGIKHALSTRDDTSVYQEILDTAGSTLKAHLQTTALVGILDRLGLVSRIAPDLVAACADGKDIPIPGVSREEVWEVAQSIYGRRSGRLQEAGTNLLAMGHEKGHGWVR